MNAGPAVTVELPVGEPVATPWGDRVLTVHRFFQHARRDWQAEAIEPAQPERSPALLVEIRAGELASDMWVARYNPQQLTINRAPYEIVYRQQSEPLGFRLGLERFRIGYYPGSDSPRSYESLVQLGDPASGVTQQAVVRMNQPVRFGGYSLFQSSFQQAGGQMVSVLGVVRDPGVSIVFAGYGLTFVGLLVVMGMRMAGIGPRPVGRAGRAGRRDAGRCSMTRHARRVTGVAPALLALLLAAALPSAPARAAGPTWPAGLDLTPVRSLPALHNGRWMPLDTLARDVVYQVTGAQRSQSQDAVAVLLSWTFEPTVWLHEPVIRIASAELRKELSLPTDQELYSYVELMEHGPLQAQIDGLQHVPPGQKLDALQQKVSGIATQLGVLGRCAERPSHRGHPEPHAGHRAVGHAALARHRPSRAGARRGGRRVDRAG